MLKGVYGRLHAPHTHQYQAVLIAGLQMIRRQLDGLGQQAFGFIRVTIGQQCGQLQLGCYGLIDLLRCVLALLLIQRLKLSDCGIKVALFQGGDDVLFLRIL